MSLTSQYKRKLTFLIAASVISNFAIAQVRLPKVFSDHMVLQRQQPIPFWGTATAGKQVTVKIAGKRYRTAADKDGKWKLQTASMKPGGPHNVSIYEDSDTLKAITFKNVLIGDVWFASGQSNMEWQVSQSRDASKEVRDAKYHDIRFFIVPHAKQVHPQDTLPGGSWVSMDTAGVKTASAVACFFARDLHEDLKVPIGIVQSTWGGTPVEAWTSREQLLASEKSKSRVRVNDTISPLHFIKDSLDLVRFWDVVYKPATTVASAVSGSGYDDANWPKVTMPRTMKDMEMSGYEGIVWLRKEIEVSQALAQRKALHIELGRPEMNYTLYVNGQEIAKTVWNANLSHKYNIPEGLLKSGKNIISVRIAFLWGGGGFNPSPEGMYIGDEQQQISIAGEWKYQKNLEPAIPVIRNYHRYPTYLFNAMINPLIPYGLKGFIWYQGEDNASSALEYRSLFPMLIKDWRSRWGQGNIPFLYVQLANYMQRKAEPSESDWATLREAQTLTLREPNTGMAVITDIGEADDIHPKNKQEVGRRLALIAKKQVYKQHIEAQSPIYYSHKVRGKEVTIKFKETGSGLKTRDGEEVKGFAIAGQDGKFAWAKARIKGNTVIVSAEKVFSPAAVRYAWADNPESNLVNSAGLPVVPFRTDMPK
jgi:sialate O-acetylesterase